MSAEEILTFIVEKDCTNGMADKVRGVGITKSATIRMDQAHGS